MKLTYVGPHDEVVVPALGACCKAGESVEATGEIAKSLVASGQWAQSDKSAAKQQDKKESA